MKLYTHTYYRPASLCLKSLENYPVSIQKTNKFDTGYIISLKGKNRNMPFYYTKRGGFNGKKKIFYFVSLYMVTNNNDKIDMFIDVKGLSLIICPVLFFIIFFLIQVKLLFQPVVLIPIQIFLTIFNMLLVLFIYKIMSVAIHRFKYYKKIIIELANMA